MQTVYHHVAALIARILIGGGFIWSAAWHLTHWSSTRSSLIGNPWLVKLLFGNNAYMAICVFIVVGVIVMLCGGLSVVLGFRARWGAIGLIVWLLIVTPIFHHQYVNDQTQMLELTKNLGLMGGLLMVFAFGSGGFSVDKFLPPPRRRRA